MTRSNTLTQMDVFRFVRRWTDGFPSIAAAARSAGVTKQTLHQQINAEKPFSDRVLRAAGIIRIQPPAEYYLRDEI
ncbi:MAG: hypothetical protein ABF968_04940 [Acetobacter sp.]|uniref:hypothetical protein n=1 Tax=Acetobacter sp. TaxID=440 RepID=UPI0039E7467A